MKIVRLRWQWVEDYSFYRIFLYYMKDKYHLMQIPEVALEGKDMPDAIVELLRAELDCIPEEIVGR